MMLLLFSEGYTAQLKNWGTISDIVLKSLVYNTLQSKNASPCTLLPLPKQYQQFHKEAYKIIKLCL